MFLPDNIDLAQAEKYSLSIRLIPNGFSFLIFSHSDKSIYFYKESTFSKNLSLIDNIKKIFFESNLFNHQFNKILVSVVSPRYTLVPKIFFDAKNANEYFEFNISGASGKVLNNHIREGEYNIIFDIDEEVYSFLFRNLWNPCFQSFTSQLLPFLRNHDEVNTKRCYVIFHDNMITIACFKNKVLLSSNTLEVSEQNDIIYHIVNIWDKHPFDQNSDFMYLAGDTEKNWESIKTLKQLIKNVVEVSLHHSLSKEDTLNIPTDILVQLCE